MSLGPNLIGYNLIGYAGAGCIALAYLLNQRGLLSSQDWRFPAANLGGSLLVLVSLGFSPNLPSIVIEIFWTTISIYGVRKNLRARNQARRQETMAAGLGLSGQNAAARRPSDRLPS